MLKQDDQTQKDLSAIGKTVEEAFDTFTQATHGALVKEGQTPRMGRFVNDAVFLFHNFLSTLSCNLICPSLAKGLDLLRRSRSRCSERLQAIPCMGLRWWWPGLMQTWSTNICYQYYLCSYHTSQKQLGTFSEHSKRRTRSTRPPTSLKKRGTALGSWHL